MILGWWKRVGAAVGVLVVALGAAACSGGFDVIADGDDGASQEPGAAGAGGGPEGAPAGGGEGPLLPSAGADADGGNVDASAESDGKAPAEPPTCDGTSAAIYLWEKNNAAPRTALYSADPAIDNPAFERTKTAFRLAATKAPSADLRTLHVVYDAATDDFMASLSTTEASYAVHGPLGKIFSKQVSGSVVVKRFRHNSQPRHKLTVGSEAAGADWLEDGPLGFVCPP